MIDSRDARLRLVIVDDLMHHLFLLLQGGFSMRCVVGKSLTRFLMEQAGLSSQYIHDRIQTVFLDGQPVDDLDMALIKDGSSLALSGAMPGLVGAAMRKGGFYGSLRSGITYEEKGPPVASRQGTVHVKIFNVLMHELGRVILQRGVLVPSKDLRVFLSRQPETFWSGCRGIFLDDAPLSRIELLQEDTLERYAEIELSICEG